MTCGGKERSNREAGRVIIKRLPLGHFALQNAESVDAVTSGLDGDL